MQKENQIVLDALAKFPGLKSLMALVKDLPSDAEMKTMTDEFVSQMDRDFEEILAYNFDDMPPVATVAAVKRDIAVPAPAASASGTVPVTIRVPVLVLNAFKQKAKDMRVPYQRLMNRQLRLVLSGL